MSPSAFRATYRVQLHAGFPLAAARALVPYLARLGISHLYTSPLLRARRGSTHGYDVVDPTALDPALGTEDDLRALAAELRAHGMGLVVDLVPNHMATGSENARWEDVLAHGPSSPFARWFDVDWSEAGGRVVLPVLGDARARVLARGEIALAYEDGRFRVRYFEHGFPLDPATVPRVLAVGTDALRPWLRRDRPERRQLEGIRAVLAALPARTSSAPTAGTSRHELADDAARRLRALVTEAPAVRAAVEAACARFSGPAGAARLEALLEAQAYRLDHWRRATGELNYRRFFDISDLIGVRVEDAGVFAETHVRVVAWSAEGLLDGVRIDHVDGLWDPRAYLERLRDALAAARPDSVPIVVEKILSPGERLRAEWPVAGTTGYEFLNALEAVFLDRDGTAAIEDWYRREIVRTPDGGGFAEVARAGKRRILDTWLAPDVRRLARRLSRLVGARGPDLDPAALRDAVVAVIAAFPVYRTYVDERTERLHPADRAAIEAALAAARGRAPAPALAALAAVLRLGDGTAAGPTTAALRRAFVQRFQQTTGAAMAKGVEDTALYRWFPLASRNEVGSDPGGSLAGAVPALHAANRERAERWPGSLLCTSTHDTKRSADVRARLDVLSELPGLWTGRVTRWRAMAAGHRDRVRGRPAPDANTEYLLYQTLVGLWPDEGGPAAVRTALLGRVQAYMQKAAREAKVHTSWLEPDAAFEGALAAFVDRVLGDAALVADVAALAADVARFAVWNALARTLVHLTAPGVADVFQGDERWTLAVVDPDNRRPVDFATRRAALEALDDRPSPLRDLVATAADGRLKLHVMRAALAARRAAPGLYGAGAYEALPAAGAAAAHVLAFARRDGERAAVVVVPRLVATLLGDPMRPPLGEAVWGDTAVALPPDLGAARLTNAVSGEPAATGSGRVHVADALATAPVALLVA